MPAKSPPMPKKAASVEATEKKLTHIEVIETISHPSRWKLLRTLREPMTAPQLSERTKITVANVFYHMRILVRAKVVKLVVAKDGSYAFHPQDLHAEIVIARDHADAIVRK